MKYEVVTHDELLGLRGALSLLERVFEDDRINLWFYGLTSNTAVLAKAQDALEEEYEIDEDRGPSPKLRMVALAIRLTSDSIHYLVGSGLRMTDEDFAYIAGGDGVRTSDFAYSTREARVTDEDFTEMAVADSDSWVDEFMAKHGGQQASEAPKVTVSRSDTATEPEVGQTAGPDVANPIDQFLAG